MTLRALLLIAMTMVTSAHGETTWQWLKRTGNCNTGSCQGGHGGLAYMNWGDDAPPVYNNIELAPDAPLATEHPFQQPAPGQRFFRFGASFRDKLLLVSAHPGEQRC